MTPKKDSHHSSRADAQLPIVFGNPSLKKFMRILTEAARKSASFFHSVYSSFKEKSGENIFFELAYEQMCELDEVVEQLREEFADGGETKVLDFTVIETKCLQGMKQTLAWFNKAVNSPIPKCAMDEAQTKLTTCEPTVRGWLITAASKMNINHAQVKELITRLNAHNISVDPTYIPRVHVNDDDGEPPAKRSRPSEIDDDDDEQYRRPPSIDDDDEQYPRVPSPTPSDLDPSSSQHDSHLYMEAPEYTSRRYDPEDDTDEDEDEEQEEEKGTPKEGEFGESWNLDAAVYMEMRLRKPKNETEKRLLTDAMRSLKKTLKETNRSREIPYNGTDEHAVELSKVLKKLQEFVVMKGAHESGKKESKLPRLLFCTTLKVDPNTATGAQIVELAKRWHTENENFVFDSASFRSDGVKNSLSSFYDRHYFDKNYGGVKGSVLDAVVVDEEDGKDMLGKLEKEGYRMSSFVLRNASKVFDFDPSAFSFEAVRAAIPKQEIEVLIQRGQHSTRNVEFFDEAKDSTVKKREWSWKAANSLPTKMTTEVAMKNMREKRDKIRAFMDDWLTHPQQRTELLAELKKSLKADELYNRTSLKADNEEKNKKTLPAEVLTNAFATNLDFTDLSEFSLQEEMIFTMWNCMLPGERFALYMKNKHPGVNSVQAYVKDAGSRTSGHQENQLLGSINYNVGPGECVWLIVPMAYAQKLDELMKKKRVVPYTRYWPDENELLKRGISFEKRIQRPNDLIYVGVGSYHWVQANGPCINIAWNVGEITSDQLLSAAMNFDHVSEHKYRAIVPVEAMIWEMAKEKVQPANDASFRLLMKSFLCRSLAKCQFEWDYAKDKYGTKLKKNNVNLTSCQRKFGDGRECPESLFNMFVIVPVDGERKPFCLGCAIKFKIDIEVCYRYEIEELVEFMDNY